MAKAIVRQLSKIPSYALPKDAICPICVQPYEDQTTDSGSFEKAVCLPCSDKHIVGSECLTEWLAYARNCPFCRHEVAFEDDDGTKAEKLFLMFTMQLSQGWEEHWYTTFWILHQNGDKAIEQKWHQWQQDWITVAAQWDAGIEAQARVALSLSPITPQHIRLNRGVVRLTAWAIQTLRFRECRLFLHLQADRADRPELKAPPVFQLTPTQETALFRELERRGAFNFSVNIFHTLNRREKWNKLRDLGFVWDPDWENSERLARGRWHMSAY